MIVSLELSPEEVAVLTAQAEAENIDIETVLHKLIARQMRGVSGQTADSESQAQQHEIATIMAAWKAEDHTDDPEELVEREREISEFVANMNRWRDEGHPSLP